MQKAFAAGLLRSGLIALAMAALLSPAQALEQVQIGQVYMIHTPAYGDCPGLTWNFAVDAQRAIIGFVECDWLTRTVNLSGTLNADDSFRMTAKEVHGSRTANVTGSFTSRVITIAIDGADSVCDKQVFKIGVSHGSGLEGGGG